MTTPGKRPRGRPKGTTKDVLEARRRGEEESAIAADRDEQEAVRADALPLNIDLNDLAPLDVLQILMRRALHRAMRAEDRGDRWGRDRNEILAGGWAKEAAAYLHPKLKQIELRDDHDREKARLLDEMTDEELIQRFQAVRGRRNAGPLQ